MKTYKRVVINVMSGLTNVSLYMSSPLSWSIWCKEKNLERLTNNDKCNGQWFDQLLGLFLKNKKKRIWHFIKSVNGLNLCCDSALSFSFLALLFHNMMRVFLQTMKDPFDEHSHCFYTLKSKRWHLKEHTFNTWLKLIKTGNCPLTSWLGAFLFISPPLSGKMRLVQFSSSF